MTARTDYPHEQVFYVVTFVDKKGTIHEEIMWPSGSRPEDWDVAKFGCMRMVKKPRPGWDFLSVYGPFTYGRPMIYVVADIRREGLTDEVQPIGREDPK